MIKLQYVLPRKEGLKLKNNNRKGSFLESAFILTISTAFVKLAGLLFTIPISNMLGGEGMGYFYAAYDIYNMLAVLASAGLPVAVSRMISETLVAGNTDEAERIYNVHNKKSQLGNVHKSSRRDCILRVRHVLSQRVFSRAFHHDVHRSLAGH